MRQLFPVRHVMGYLFSLILSVVALSVVYYDMPFAVGMSILLVTAFIQASLQLFVFMHISEAATRGTLYLNIAYALFVALVTIFGSLFALVWGWY